MYLIRNKQTGEYHKRGYGGFEWKKFPHQGWSTNELSRAIEEAADIGFDQCEVVSFLPSGTISGEQARELHEEFRQKEIEHIKGQLYKLDVVAKHDLDRLSVTEYERWKDLREKLRELGEPVTPKSEYP